MAGRGKNGKQATRSASKKQSNRHEAKQLSHTVITNGSIRRLARRGGVKRISFATHNSVK
jgi:hypothetical protein